MAGSQAVANFVGDDEEIEQHELVQVSQTSGYVACHSVTPLFVAYTIDECDTAAEVSSEHGMVEDNFGAGIDGIWPWMQSHFFQC